MPKFSGLRERIIEANPGCRIIESNGLSGQGASELAEMIRDIPKNCSGLSLRHSAPLAICTLCTGEMRISKKHHTGVLRHINGFMEYRGE